VVLYVLPGEQGLRAGFVSGRSVGDAVRRNRARRVLREAWRAVAPRARGGFDVVFVARPEIQGARTQDVAEDIERALGAAGVIVS
jgi:ribonuclease P protein component